MQEEYIKAGSVDVRIPVHIIDSSTLQAVDNTAGRGKTGLAYNTGSLVCYYFREDGGNAASVAIGLASYVRGATHVDGGFAEQDATNSPGDYWLCLPDAVVAAGAGWAMVTLKGAAGMIQATIKVNIVADNSIVSVLVGTGSAVGSIVTSLTVPAVSIANQWNNRVLVFDNDTPTAALRSQGCRILSMTVGGVLTLQDNLTTAPANGDHGKIF